VPVQETTREASDLSVGRALPSNLLKGREMEEMGGRIMTVTACGGEPLSLVERLDAWLLTFAQKLGFRQPRTRQLQDAELRFDA
jgi:hypothetical protein